MMTQTRNQLIDDFADWLQETEGYAKERADREAWDFIAGAYSDGDTLEDFQAAWSERDGKGGPGVYVVRETSSGWAVFRRDGSYAEFLDKADADEAAEFLAKGEREESDFEWTDGDDS